ncbi:MAG TPA: glycosyltransferase [Clostridia bacterium]|nr:glycosyltransferase [Clostridia bacterium]
MIKVSFIVPVYKVEEYIRECIDSILNQTLQEFEVILVDDGSPDNCPEICDEYAKKDERIKVIHKENGGLSQARNFGMRAAQGEYIIFVDSDDYLLKDFAKRLYDAIVEYDADIVQCGYTECTQTGEEIKKVKTLLPLNTVIEGKKICEQFEQMHIKLFAIYCWRNIYKKDFLLGNDIFFNENVKIGEDAVFNTQAFLLAKRIAAIESVSYFYRLREESIMREKFKSDYCKKLNYQWSKKREEYKKYCESPSPLYYNDIARYCLVTLLPTMLKNIYKNDVENKYAAAKEIYLSNMIRVSLKEFDITVIRSKSLDWVLLLMIKHRLWFFAHLICKHVLF